MPGCAADRPCPHEARLPPLPAARRQQRSASLVHARGPCAMQRLRRAVACAGQHGQRHWRVHLDDADRWPGAGRGVCVRWDCGGWLAGGGFGQCVDVAPVRAVSDREKDRTNCAPCGLGGCACFGSNGVPGLTLADGRIRVRQARGASDYCRTTGRSIHNAASAATPSREVTHKAAAPTPSISSPNSSGAKACATRAGAIIRPWRSP